jgi:hypothetical protein
VNNRRLWAFKEANAWRKLCRIYTHVPGTAAGGELVEDLAKSGEGFSRRSTSRPETLFDEELYGSVYVDLDLGYNLPAIVSTNDLGVH